MPLPQPIIIVLDTGSLGTGPLSYFGYTANCLYYQTFQLPAAVLSHTTVTLEKREPLRAEIGKAGAQGTTAESRDDNQRSRAAFV